LADVEKHFKDTNKIKFYGARSQTLFKQRTTALDKFSNKVKPLLDGADLETRVYLLHMLKMAYKNIAQEVLNTPIPEGLDEETMAQVAQKISEMADPFDRVNVFTNVQEKERIQKNIAGSNENYAAFILIPDNLIKTAMMASNEETDSLYKRLNFNPDDKDSLMGLKELYRVKNNTRLEAYFSGRLELIKEEVKLK
jgi:hypothetical protein